MTARAAPLLLAMLLLAACGPAQPIEPPDPCNQTTNFTFFGRATAGALGIAGPGDPTAQTVGTAWVTADPVDWGGGPDTFQRAICIAYEDGSGSGQSIEDDWELPPGVVAADIPAGAPGIGSILLIVLVLGAVAFSAVAFIGGRNGRGPASS